MTIKVCLDYCKSKGTKYAGLEYHRECYCDNSIAQDAKANAVGCTATCKGNPNEICGGSNRMNVYQAILSGESFTTSLPSSTTSSSTAEARSSTTSSTTTSKPSSTTTPSFTPASKTTTPSTLTTTTRPGTNYITPTPSSTATPTKGFYSLGCYAEPPAPTKKPMTQLLSSDTMSPDLCISALSSANAKNNPGTTYNVFGLEYGRECWAATALVTSQTSLVGDRACNLKCAGDKGVSCGGRGMYNYYVATAFETTLRQTSLPVRTSGTVRATASA
ncbi:MAG: hypothetical protein Q9219_005433 [cf. Caloplaca sp. 3 TL-2023]